MYTPEQVVELVEAALNKGANDGARNAYDTVAFIDSYAAAVDDPDPSEYDALYLEVTGQKVDDLLDRVAGLERWAYATPVGTAPDDETRCQCSDCVCKA